MQGRTQRNRGAWGVFVAVLLAAGGCSSPCDKLAEAGCEQAGSGSEHCKKMQAQAAKAGLDEQRACKRALRLVDALSKNR
jgi:hypothetical protein